jgi:hypothetical protein
LGGALPPAALVAPLADLLCVLRGPELAAEAIARLAAHHGCVVGGALSERINAGDDGSTTTKRAKNGEL